MEKIGKLSKKSYNEQIRISEANKARALKGIEEDLGYAKWIGYKPFQESLEKLKKLLDDMRTYIGKETIESSITEFGYYSKTSCYTVGKAARE